MAHKTDTLCHMAWDYPMFFMFDPAIGYCCRTPRVGINENDLERLGEDYWSNLPVFVERRENLLKGIKDPACDTCWQLENAGFKSSRNDAYIEHFMRRNIPEFPKDLPYDQYKDVPGIEKSNYSHCIEVVLNNTCDAKCTYCSHIYSTQWVTEKKKFGDLDSNFQISNNRSARAEELFWGWYEHKTIFSNRRFGFIGGEPFIIDALYECFDKLIEIHERVRPEVRPGYFKPELCITSNLNTPPAYFQKFLEYLPKLKTHFKIIIQVSGENVGDDLEYIRHGVKWNRWSKNIEYLLANTSVQLAFLPCLNLLSIPRFADYLQYFKDLSEKYRYMKIHQNIVTWPSEQSPMMAPREFAVHFDRCIDIIQSMIDKKIDNTLDPSSIHNSLVNFLDWLKRTQEAVSKNQSEVEVTDNAVAFYRFFAQLDDRRNTDVTVTIPEIKNYFEAGRQGEALRRIIPIHKA